SNQVEFNEPKSIQHDQFVLNCFRNSPAKELIYSKAFVNVPIATGPAKAPKFLDRSVKKPSMAVLIFDSVSLNQFKRSMPRTTKFLIDNDFFTFNMYNEAIIRQGDPWSTCVDAKCSLAHNVALMW
ncbi:hypothetical protein COOONC_21251, partial [Cooperia oncophora]